jgi:hypothetical protein
LSSCVVQGKLAGCRLVSMRGGLLRQPQATPGLLLHLGPLAVNLLDRFPLPVGQALPPDLLLQLSELVPQLDFSLPTLPITAVDMFEIPDEPEDHGAHQYHHTREGDVSGGCWG